MRKEGKRMPTTITADTINDLAKLIGSLIIIGGAILAVYKFCARSKAQTEQINQMKLEQTLICYGVLCCLKGLKEQGCNGPVTKALEKLEKYLNKAAHGIFEEEESQ